MDRNELVGTAVAVVLLVTLIVGVAFNIWTLSSVLSLLPYFLILAMATALGWGFRSRLGSWFGSQDDRDARQKSVARSSSEGPVSRPERRMTDGERRDRRWRVQSLQLGPVGVELSDAPVSNTVPLHSSRVKVRPGKHQELPFLLSSGDKIEGTATDSYGREFDWYFFDDQNYAAYYADKRATALARGTDTPSAHVNITIPHSGTWHLVLDAGGKRSSRSIDVRLTKAPAG